MKKLVLMIVAVVAVAFNSIAQDTESILFGIKVGTNYSNVYDSQGEEFEADGKFGFAAGAFLSIPLGPIIGIQPEVLFSQKGFKGSGRMFGSPYTITRTTNYIDIPLFVAVKPTESITLLAGPQFSYLIKQKDTFNNSTTNIQQQEEFDNDNIRKNTVSFIGGLDFNFDHAVVGARAGWDISKNNGDGSSTTPRYKNVWLQATIGYRF